MLRLKIDQDIRPLSEVRTGIANFIKQVHDTKRPVIITQHGKSVAVLLDAHEYEAMQEKLELLTDVQISLNQLESGQGINHEDACIFRTIPAGDSGRSRPPIPIDSGHRFRRKPATHSGAFRPPL